MLDFREVRQTEAAECGLACLTMIARFHGRADKPEADFTWWIYSLGVYREVFAMLGFRIAKVSHAEFYYMYGDRFEERSTIVAERDEVL